MRKKEKKTVGPVQILSRNLTKAPGPQKMKNCSLSKLKDPQKSPPSTPWIAGSLGPEKGPMQFVWQVRDGTRARNQVSQHGHGASQVHHSTGLHWHCSKTASCEFKLSEPLGSLWVPDVLLLSRCRSTYQRKSSWDLVIKSLWGKTEMWTEWIWWSMNFRQRVLQESGGFWVAFSYFSLSCR